MGGAVIGNLPIYVGIAYTKIPRAESPENDTPLFSILLFANKHFIAHVYKVIDWRPGPSNSTMQFCNRLGRNIQARFLTLLSYAYTYIG